jgi:hypothetical protein
MAGAGCTPVPRGLGARSCVFHHGRRRPGKIRMSLNAVHVRSFRACTRTWQVHLHVHDRRQILHGRSCTWTCTCTGHDHIHETPQVGDSRGPPPSASGGGSRSWPVNIPVITRPRCVGRSTLLSAARTSCQVRSVFQLVIDIDLLGPLGVARRRALHRTYPASSTMSCVVAPGSSSPRGRESQPGVDGSPCLASRHGVLTAAGPRNSARIHRRVWTTLS